MKKVFIASIAFGLLLTSCGVMGVTSTPSEYVSAGQEVSTKRENTNILTLTPMDVHKTSAEMLEELKAKCPKGITNVRTSHSMKSYYVVSMEKMEMTCNCK